MQYMAAADCHTHVLWNFFFPSIRVIAWQLSVSLQMQCNGTCLQVQMQIEADQQLAALQQQRRPSMQREWANAPMGSLRPAYGQHTNAQGSLDGHGSHDGVVMMSQNGSPMDDSPPNQSHVSGTSGINTHHAPAFLVQGIVARAKGLVFRRHTIKMFLSGSHHVS